MGEGGGRASLVTHRNIRRGGEVISPNTPQLFCFPNALGLAIKIMVIPNVAIFPEGTFSLSSAAPTL